MAAPHFSTLSDPPDVREAKRAARRDALRIRAACDPAAGEHLAAVVLAWTLIPAGSVVAGFWPLAGEIDLRSLLHALHAKGERVALPVTPPRGQPLSFRIWTPDAVLMPGRFNTVHPAGEVVTPDIVLVPLLAFDRRGFRLGYGGGYYDRTLAGLPDAVSAGCAFAAQEVSSVPTGPHDARLTYIATEQGVISCMETGR